MSEIRKIAGLAAMGDELALAQLGDRLLAGEQLMGASALITTAQLGLIIRACFASFEAKQAAAYAAGLAKIRDME